MRNSYDVLGRPVKVETGELSAWKSETVAPASWGSAFTVLSSVETSYDAQDRKIKEVTKGSDSIIASVTQYSYDNMGRLQCSVVRMNSALFSGTLPAACTLGTTGTQGPDRITKNIYDSAGQLLQVRKAVGITTANGFSQALEQAYVTYSYTPDGLQQDIVDANGNGAELRYDGFDRQTRWVFPPLARQAGLPAFNPSTPATALSTASLPNEGDYEEYGYDANGNRLSLRKRDGSYITYTYDALNRITVKNVDTNGDRTDLAATDRQDVYYSYNARGIQTAARFGSTSGQGILTTVDGFSRATSVTNGLISASPALAYQYDKHDNVTALTYPDGISIDFAFDKLGRVATIKKGGTVLVAPTFTQRASVGSVDRYNAALDQVFGYDNLGRLDAFYIGTGAQTDSAKVSWDYTRNAASQTASEARDNDLYAWTGRQNGGANYTTNGLNQYSVIGSTSLCYDANGNLTADDLSAYRYDIENRLVEMRDRVSPSSCPTKTSGYTGKLVAQLHYDPLGRLLEALEYDDSTPGNPLTNDTRFLYDGDALVLEYAHAGGGADTIINRYIHGNAVGADDPLIWYNGSNTADADIRNLYADPLGSIVLVMGQDGAKLGINTYDEWGGE